ncbi:hypothetical protein GALMADRAFT_240780 [Galerina marginata CBS 339.88]|uniref:DUF6593 domain-containing protein n=1 Tax=Galerina marginata (strain CBS 339.88) TaxID=685588 RepID=A0A067TTH2_GALM3|nr:hypothetical protein GALMADRAFT_240780 [Galerina marginata CBS 339.88]
MSYLSQIPQSNEMLSSSEVTLVNPSPPTKLTFTKPGTLNNTLLLDNRPYFKVATLDPAGARTTITDAQTNELLVTIKRKSFQSDTIKFAHRYGGKSVKQKDWLVAGNMEDGSPKWTIQTSVGDFIWRRDIVYRLALCPENDIEHPVAYCQFPTLEDRSISWALLLTRGTESFRDEIVASFLILEQVLRIEEKNLGVSGYIMSNMQAQMAFNFSAASMFGT